MITLNCQKQQRFLFLHAICHGVQNQYWIWFFPSCREPNDVPLSKTTISKPAQSRSKFDKSWQPILQNQILLKINFEPSHGLTRFWAQCGCTASSQTHLRVSSLKPISLNASPGSWTQYDSCPAELRRWVFSTTYITRVTLVWLCLCCLWSLSWVLWSLCTLWSWATFTLCCTTDELDVASLLLVPQFLLYGFQVWCVIETSAANKIHFLA